MKAPAFQLYASDFLGDALVDIMEPEELGGYFRLLLVAWQMDEPGYLPNDAELLAKWSRLRRRWSACAPAILACFKTAPDGRLYQKRMVAVAAEQAVYREKQRVKGIASAEARKAKVNHGSTTVQPRLDSGCPPVDARLQPQGNPLPLPPSPPESLSTLAPPVESRRFDIKAICARYPRKKDMAKGRKKLEAVVKTQADYEAVMRGLDRFLSEERRKGTAVEFYPYFATWVNGRRWEDEDDAPVAAAPARQYADLGEMFDSIGGEQ